MRAVFSKTGTALKTACLIAGLVALPGTAPANEAAIEVVMNQAKIVKLAREADTIVIGNPEIADAAVYGVPHDELGEEVKATVQLEAGSSLTEVDVRQWVADGLANFKVPAYLDLTTDKLPRNASGKLLKNVLRGEGVVSFEETM